MPGRDRRCRYARPVLADILLSAEEAEKADFVSEALDEMRRCRRAIELATLIAAMPPLAMDTE